MINIVVIVTELSLKIQYNNINFIKCIIYY